MAGSWVATPGISKVHRAGTVSAFFSTRESTQRLTVRSDISNSPASVTWLGPRPLGVDPTALHLSAIVSSTARSTSVRSRTWRRTKCVASLLMPRADG
jgi:hypothetical protein